MHLCELAIDIVPHAFFIVLANPFPGLELLAFPGAFVDQEVLENIQICEHLSLGMEKEVRFNRYSLFSMCSLANMLCLVNSNYLIIFDMEGIS